MIILGVISFRKWWPKIEQRWPKTVHLVYNIILRKNAQTRKLSFVIACNMYFFQIFEVKFTSIRQFFVCFKIILEYFNPIKFFLTNLRKSYFYKELFLVGFVLKSYFILENSRLRIERRKRGNAQRASSSHDRFRLEVRILFYRMRTLKLAARVTLIIAGMWWWAGRETEYKWRDARGTGAQPRWGPMAKPRQGVRGAPPPPPDCRETKLKCRINEFCHEMRHD